MHTTPNRLKVVHIPKVCTSITANGIGGPTQGVHTLQATLLVNHFPTTMHSAVENFCEGQVLAYTLVWHARPSTKCLAC